jgi:membrane protease YdiL (CAAX protease family)
VRRSVPPVVVAAGVAGSALVRASLTAEVDSRRFYLLTASLAGTWTGTTLLAAGPVPAGSIRPAGLIRPVVTGAATFGLFYGIASVARRLPLLHRAIGSVLRYVDEGSTLPVLLTATVNAVAEELYFRGAVWQLAEASQPLLRTTAVYTAATAATGNPALVAGGALTSLIFGAERARSGGVIAPAIAHVTWSVLMLTVLPPLFRARPAARKLPAADRRARAGGLRCR